MGLDRRSDYFAARRVAEMGLALIGVILLVGAVGADHSWFDQHFLPEFFKPQAPRYRTLTVVRVAVAAAGLVLLVFLRPRLGRIAAHGSGRALHAGALRLSLALVLALACTELLLHTRYFKARHQTVEGREPLQRQDPRLGWVLVPERVGYRDIGGRRIEYAVDEQGQRVRCAECPVDPERPTLLFTGESIMLGTGLSWDESLPAQLGSLLQTQSANLAVNGYSSDQAYLRLSMELPRFRKPVAVVSLFMPSLFVRNLDDDRPHLDAALLWLPARQPWRLEALFRRLLPYHSLAAIDRGVAMTRAVLRATLALARSRQAKGLILVPQFVPETAADQALRRRILNDGGVPYLAVELDPDWHLRGDDHPDARAVRAMAVAIAARLSDGDQPRTLRTGFSAELSETGDQALAERQAVPQFAGSLQATR